MSVRLAFAFVRLLFFGFETFLDYQCSDSKSDVEEASEHSAPNIQGLGSGIVRWKTGADKLDLHFFTWLVEVERSQTEVWLTPRADKLNLNFLI